MSRINIVYPGGIASVDVGERAVDFQHGNGVHVSVDYISSGRARHVELQGENISVLADYSDDRVLFWTNTHIIRYGMLDTQKVVVEGGALVRDKCSCCGHEKTGIITLS